MSQVEFSLCFGRQLLLSCWTERKARYNQETYFNLFVCSLKFDPLSNFLGVNVLTISSFTEINMLVFHNNIMVSNAKNRAIADFP